MPVPLAAYIGREICLGLSAVHRLCGPDGTPMHVVHRDATPSNVLTTSAGAVKLVDFGIARSGLPRVVTQTGQVKGKPAYLAPEQLRGGERIDARADLFATGVVLHEMLTLQSPFDDDNPLATLYQVVEKEVPPPSRRRPEIPRALDRIVLRALEKLPARRYQSAEEMAAALSPIAGEVGDGRAAVAALVAMWKQVQGGRA